MERFTWICLCLCINFIRILAACILFIFILNTSQPLFLLFHVYISVLLWLLVSSYTRSDFPRCFSSSPSSRESSRYVTILAAHTVIVISFPNHSFLQRASTVTIATWLYGSLFKKDLSLTEKAAPQQINEAIAHINACEEMFEPKFGNTRTPEIWMVFRIKYYCKPVEVQILCKLPRMKSSSLNCT